MANAPTETIEPARKQARIIQFMRHRIVAGDFAPGEKLPTHVELMKQFKVTSLTVQRALDRLREEGYVDTHGRGGTRVTAAPPCLRQYAFVIPHSPSSSGWVHFWSVLCDVANTMKLPGERSIKIFYDVNGRRENAEYQALVDAVRSHAVSGLIFPSAPFDLYNSPIFADPDLPRVAVALVNDAQQLPVVVLDNASFYVRAIDCMAARQRKRTALLTVPNVHPANYDLVARQMAAKGITTERYWTQVVSQAAPEGARGVVHLLMHDPAKRPDSLIITDDNLVEQAILGLKDAGVRVPEDIDVVAHCNFPWPTPSIIPIKRLGFDARHILNACVESLERQRTKKERSFFMRIPACFEDELGKD